MLVRQLVGRFAGQIVDMPFHVATACLANGTTEHPDAPVRVRGLNAEGAPSTEGRAAANIGANRMMEGYPTRSGSLQLRPGDDTPEAANEGATADAEDPLQALRAEYQELSGEAADGRWGEPRLRAEINKIRG